MMKQPIKKDVIKELEKILKSINKTNVLIKKVIDNYKLDNNSSKLNEISTDEALEEVLQIARELKRDGIVK